MDGLYSFVVCGFPSGKGILLGLTNQRRTDMNRHYNYDSARKLCEERGMTFDERLVPTVDAHFHRYKFTQNQVDGAMSAHIWAVEFIFNPRSYTFKQRLMLAFHFLFR